MDKEEGSQRMRMDDECMGGEEAGKAPKGGDVLVGESLCSLGEREPLQQLREQSTDLREVSGRDQVPE